MQIKKIQRNDCTLIHSHKQLHTFTTMRKRRKLFFKPNREEMVHPIKFTTTADEVFSWRCSETVRNQNGWTNRIPCEWKRRQSKLEPTHEQIKRCKSKKKNNHYRERHGFARDFFWNHLPFIPVKESYEYERNKDKLRTKKNKTQKGKQNLRNNPNLLMSHVSRCTWSQFSGSILRFFLRLHIDYWVETPLNAKHELGSHCLF